jgi:hypothetical protein
VVQLAAAVLARADLAGDAEKKGVKGPRLHDGFGISRYCSPLILTEPRLIDPSCPILSVIRPL